MARRRTLTDAEREQSRAASKAKFKNVNCDENASRPSRIERPCGDQSAVQPRSGVTYSHATDYCNSRGIFFRPTLSQAVRHLIKEGKAQ